MATFNACVYVIELDSGVLAVKKFVEANPHMKAGMDCLCVGQTAHDPEVRFAQHKRGYKCNRFAKQYGKRLRPDLVPPAMKPLMTRDQAEAAEVLLAIGLRLRGFAVWQN
jgi:hypothetical protein